VFATKFGAWLEEAQFLSCATNQKYGCNLELTDLWKGSKEATLEHFKKETAAKVLGNFFGVTCVSETDTKCVVMPGMWDLAYYVFTQVGVSPTTRMILNNQLLSVNPGDVILGPVGGLITRA
jgi:hypothetical protein